MSLPFSCRFQVRVEFLSRKLALAKLRCLASDRHKWMKVHGKCWTGVVAADVCNFFSSNVNYKASARICVFQTEPLLSRYPPYPIICYICEWKNSVQSRKGFTSS